MSIDIAAIRARHLNAEQLRGRTLYEGHVLVDLAALCDEVDRLRQMPVRFELGGGTMSFCPASERPCDRGCPADRCLRRDGCTHPRTLQAVVGDTPGYTRVETVCVDCGAKLP